MIFIALDYTDGDKITQIKSLPPQISQISQITQITRIKREIKSLPGINSMVRGHFNILLYC